MGVELTLAPFMQQADSYSPMNHHYADTDV
jgi:hypothetical protein